ncbi:hypothetical protein BHU62_12000 [Serratia marcescens]|uniref:Uncharacterized protein n=1 Tax=Serratia marcescens TaxID=615 RepID=A0A1Q4P0A7_SERMA|nr:hypothetical protein [Serratia marcescens]OKB66585.1 hypothetical protein BHU62_12000 [Serratia marcescens]
MTRVSPNSYPQGIIAKGHIEKDFRFLILSDSALTLIQSQLVSFSLSQRRSANRALFYFECLLWLTNHPPITNMMDFVTRSFLNAQRLFYGAVYSNCFLSSEVKYSSRRKLIQCFFKLLDQLSKKLPVRIFAHADLTESQTRQCVVQFESTCIDSLRAARLTGWHMVDRSFGSFRLKMRTIFDIMGADFTNALHQESQKHALTHGHYGNYVNVISRFDDFVRWYSDDANGKQPLYPDMLQDPMFVHQFFWAFQRWHFESYSKRNQTQPTERVLANLQRQWIRIICWAKMVLVRSGLMSSPLGGVWPEGSKKLTRSLCEVGHHRYADGEALVSQKLLTRIPLSVTDQEATELLFMQIEADFNKVLQWARRQIEHTTAYLNASIIACEKGELITLGARISSQKYGEPEMAMNSLIKTIKESYGGFTVINHTMRGYLASATGFSFSAAELAENLALPTKYVIAPIAIWLVAQHPILTDASLLGCELFDRNGKRTGFILTDSGAVLVVKKNRKGSQQEVVLSAESASVIKLLIQITTPARNYLKAKDDDGWRRLFIVVGGQGFQEPYVFTNQISFAKIIRQKTFIQAHYAELGELINALSLARIRATAGVLVYLNSLSIDKMAESLGNSKRVAINYYLPPTIIQFFQERWIRIFQNTVIVHAMKDSPFLLDATDFKSISELDQFLKIHTLRVFPDVSGAMNGAAEQELAVPGAEIVISLDEEILGVLLSLKLAVENAGPRATGTAVYWSEFAVKVESHIESDDFSDPYIRSFLVKARRIANPKQFEELVYVR